MVKKKQNEDLTTPLHDALVLQLLNPENAIKLLEVLGYKHDEWKIGISDQFIKDNKYYRYPSNQYLGKYKQEQLQAILDDAYNNYKEKVNQELEQFKSTYKPISRSDIKIEVPVGRGGIWSIDVMIKVPLLLSKASIISDPFFCIIDDTKVDVKFIGNGDLCNESLPYQLPFIEENPVCTIVVEVKPIITSLGELMRQLNKYRKWYQDEKAKSFGYPVFDSNLYVVYSPDERFRNEIENEGIIFVTPAELGLEWKPEEILTSCI